MSRELEPTSRAYWGRVLGLLTLLVALCCAGMLGLVALARHTPDPDDAALERYYAGKDQELHALCRTHTAAVLGKDRATQVEVEQHIRFIADTLDTGQLDLASRNCIAEVRGW